MFQAAATEGQSIFVATGDQGSQGCNVNGVDRRHDGQRSGGPGRRHLDGNALHREQDEQFGQRRQRRRRQRVERRHGRSVSTGSIGPDAVALDSSDHKVFVANAGSTLTVFSSSTCNQTTTSGCGSPTQIASGGHLDAPGALAVNGSTLYVGNTNSTVAVYNARQRYVTTVNLPSCPDPTALAVDAANGFVYVADGSNNRIEYFNAVDLQRHDAQQVVAQRRQRSPSATLPSPSPSPAAPATSMWPMPGAVAESRWSA